MCWQPAFDQVSYSRWPGIQDTEGYLIGEIKPANAAGVLEADKDLLWYEQPLGAFGFAASAWRSHHRL